MAKLNLSHWQFYLPLCVGQWEILNHGLPCIDKIDAISTTTSYWHIYVSMRWWLILHLLVVDIASIGGWYCIYRPGARVLPWGMPVMGGHSGTTSVLCIDPESKISGCSYFKRCSVIIIVILSHFSSDYHRQVKPRLWNWCWCILHLKANNMPKCEPFCSCINV